ncbi:MAG: hypothetical protein V2I76_08610 [Roseobacter sp.]|jgi:hypothetical protein|nr:hypothetical protein [Roseobacter sp.]
MRYRHCQFVPYAEAPSGARFSSPTIHLDHANQDDELWLAGTLRPAIPIAGQIWGKAPIALEVSDFPNDPGETNRTTGPRLCRR